MHLVCYFPYYSCLCTFLQITTSVCTVCPHNARKCVFQFAALSGQFFLLSVAVPCKKQNKKTTSYSEYTKSLLTKVHGRSMAEKCQLVAFSINEQACT